MVLQFRSLRIAFFLTVYAIYAPVHGTSEIDEVTLDKIGFLKNTCQYGNLFLVNPWTPPGVCVRLTCHAEERKLSVERCSTVDDKGAFCRSEIQEQSMKFPFCCRRFICNDGRNFSLGTMKEYTAGKNEPLHGLQVMATGSWEAETEYMFSDCEHGSCNYRTRTVGRTPIAFSNPCKTVQSQDDNQYVRTVGCPIYSKCSHKNCVKIDGGKSSKLYPKCCPEYMCPPTAPTRETMDVITTVPVVNGYCVYNGEMFETTKHVRQTCELLVCNVRAKTVTRKLCINTQEMAWRHCKPAPCDQPLEGAFPQCCPKYICPVMTTKEGQPEADYPEPPAFQFFTPDVCDYYGTKFKGSYTDSHPCEERICVRERRQLKVRRCQSNLLQLPPGCGWEYKDQSQKFPECCQKHVCRYPYHTRFPGTLPPALPEP